MKNNTNLEESLETTDFLWEFLNRTPKQLTSPSLFFNRGSIDVDAWMRMSDSQLAAAVAEAGVNDSNLLTDNGIFSNKTPKQQNSPSMLFNRNSINVDAWMSDSQLAGAAAGVNDSSSLAEFFSASNFPSLQFTGSFENPETFFSSWNNNSYTFDYPTDTASFETSAASSEIGDEATPFSTGNAATPFSTCNMSEIEPCSSGNSRWTRSFSSTPDYYSESPSSPPSFTLQNDVELSNNEGFYPLLRDLTLGDNLNITSVEISSLNNFNSHDLDNKGKGPKRTLVPGDFESKSSPVEEPETGVNYLPQKLVPLAPPSSLENGDNSECPSSPRDINGRRPRNQVNRKYKCTHCSLIFINKDLDKFAEHVAEVEKEEGGLDLTRRRFKCKVENCPWRKIGFTRNLECKKHFTRKHGIAKLECPFWAPDGQEKYPGSNVCRSRMHTDSGNLTRHTQNVHNVPLKKKKKNA